MSKRNLILYLILLLSATACGGEAGTTTGVVADIPTSAPPEATAETVATDQTAATLETVDTGEYTVPEPEPAPGNGCTLTNSAPEAPSEYVELFGVTETDWAKGPETAALTIVEYGDFQ